MNLDRFKSFDRKDERLDDFYFCVLVIQKYKELAYIVKIILTLSHGQAAVERGFSIGKSILNVNMNTELIVSKKIVKDHMISHSVKPHNFQIRRQLIISCNAAYSKYKDSLIAAEKAKAKQEVSKEKSIVIYEISKVSLNCNELLEVSKSLNEEFAASIREAEKDERNCFTMLANGNALKRKRESLLVNVKKLDETLELLEAKKQMLDK